MRGYTYLILGGKETIRFLRYARVSKDWAGEFKLGSEIFIPFSNTGTFQGEYDLGDIELQMIKYVFLNESERTLTGVFGMGLLTGDASRGLETGQTKLEGQLLLDQAYRNWYLGINAEFASSIAGEPPVNWNWV